MMNSVMIKARAHVLVGQSAAIMIRNLLVLIFLGVSPFSQTAMAQSYTFSKLEVTGNKRIESSTILSYVGLTRNQTTSAGDLNAAYRNILASGLFEQVELTPVGGVLQITVVELPTLNEVVFEGNARLKTEVLQKVIGSQSRRVFNPELVEQDAVQIAQAYVQAGRLAAKVIPKAIRRSDNRVDLIFEIFEGGLVEIERLSFVGNTAFSDRRLRGVLATKQAGIFRSLVGKDTFISDRIEYDKQLLKDFYSSRGYVDFQIIDVSSELSRERDGMFVTFIVKEGQKFTFGDITVVSDIETLDLETFQKAIKTKNGAVYSPLPVETDISRMERLALLKGFDFLRVEPNINRNDRSLSLDVEYRLSNGPRVFVERINITGNTTTIESVIRRQFKVIEGDPFNPRAVRQSAERIKALGFFSNSAVEPREGSSSTQAIIDVVVKEQPTGTLSLGGTYSSTAGFAAEISFRERNFLGRGQSVGVTLSNASTTKKYEFSFQDPGFLNRDLVAGVDLSYAETNFDDSAFNTSELSFAPYMAFPLAENSTLRVGYSLAKTGVADNSASASDVGKRIQVEVGKGDVVNSVFGYRYGYDSRRSGLNPNAGFLLQFGQDIGGFGGDNSFLKTTAKGIAQTKVMAEEVTLAATFEGGTLRYFEGNSRVSDRFSLGSSTMRGFSSQGIGPRERSTSGLVNDALGGLNFAVARFEVGFPIGIPNEYGLSGGVFYDVGSLWGLETPTSNSCAIIWESGCVLYEKMTLRQTVGFSLFWETPIGPLRFNFMDVLKSEKHDRVETFELTVSSRF